jgi:predicted GIY-YIG superfamily endonuclease
LNYHQTTDFVIDLDNVWEWLGFNQKYGAKRVLERHFNIDTDYKNLLPRSGEQDGNNHGGHNKEVIMLNIKTFKLFCLKAGTKKADEIHEYYMKLEETLQELVEEQTTELKNQLSNVLISNEKEKDTLKEKTLLDQFARNMQCIYYGKVDNKSVSGEKLIKFGYSNDLSRRVEEHKKNYTNFILVNAFKVTNQIQIENAIKKHEVLKKKRRNILIENINYTELLAIDSFSFDEIDNMIKQIIQENEYNIENYKLLVEKNQQLEYNLLKSEKEIKSKNEEIAKLTEKLANYKPDEISLAKGKLGSDFNITKYGYFLYAFQYDDMRFQCSIVRQSSMEQLTDNLKKQFSNGEMKYYTKVSYPFTEKLMIFIMKNSMCFLGNSKFEGSYEDIKKAIDVTIKLETMLIQNSKNIEQLSVLLDGNLTQIDSTNTLNILNTLEEDPEIPQVRKAKRAIDQIDPVTNTVIASFESIESAGRALGLTTGTAIGIALRNKTVCRSFLWRYSGISRDDQYSEQPVIKIRCSTGEKTNFKHIAEAAKDANISAPGLRQRILTKVHIDDFHWIFDKSEKESHYT